MKDLNKKIGAGVLVVGLVIGGGLGLSGGLVAHADSVSVQGQVDEDPFAGLEGVLIDESELDKLLEEVLGEVSVKVEKVEGEQLIIVSPQE